MAELTNRLAELESLGLKIVLIGNGKFQYIQGFIERYKLEDSQVVIVTDPSLQSYRAVEMRRSIWATFGWNAVRGIIRAVIHGHFQNSLEGDLLQQGGTILLDQDQRIVFCHRNKSLTEYAEMTDLVDSIYLLLMKDTAPYCGKW
ncbi:CAS/CSE protein [Candidatus Scalindua japonica]|uniref:CAS/CSE protein n=2 Tax=Candidatus Scalindua japonica TaxID=1284222 RepID=A0A286U328_9BACT|nr:CAS/CSE protein [Candidatus Scalindua japonica]